MSKPVEQPFAYDPASGKHPDWPTPEATKEPAQTAPEGPAAEAQAAPEAVQELAQTAPEAPAAEPAPKRWQKIVAWSIIAVAGLIALWMLWLSLSYLGVRIVADAEYGEGLPDAAIFAPRKGAEYRFVPDDIAEKGTHRLTVWANGGERIVWMRVMDTTAPQAEGVECTISSLVMLRPDDLIENLKDADLVKVSFLETPPFGTVGDHAVTILLEDVSGNQSSVESLLHIRVLARDIIELEAGEEAPTAADYLIDEYPDAAMTEVTEQMLHTPGTYDLTLTADTQVHTVTLHVVDTTKPIVKTEMQYLLPGTPIMPEQFLTEVIDETATTSAFLTAPDPDDHDFQQVTIRVTDAGGNYTDVSESLLLTHTKPVVMEARSTPVTAYELLPEGASEAENVRLAQTFAPNRIGRFAMTLVVDGEPEIALLEVVDTTPPAITAPDLSWYTNHPKTADELCTVLDVTETTVTTEAPIDWMQEGAQTVTLTATDSAGNTASATMTLTLVRDAEAPELYGVKDRNGYVGEPVAYLNEVFAVDTLDGENVSITVDTSAVDYNRAGTYPVTYTATDRDGNATSLSAKITFVNSTVTDEEVEALAKAVMAEITTPDMTRTEKLVAIYNYARNHVRYVGTSDKTDWRKEAKRGFETARGDCFTFYSVTRALLDQTDIDYMSVERKGGRTRHYWVIVNVGTGWYHYDPILAPNHKHRCFMWTNQQCKIKPYFWRYEESIYPEIATARFDADAVIAMEKAGTLVYHAETGGNPS
ncbi:MAG: transglutaminase domain-containing protein [Clostridia bacterium]|nr:transglutaminase domain-containing protein [Clostridia bacterium]